MRNKKMRFAGVGLLIAPFFVAGWFIASWLSNSYPKDSTRGAIFVIDPPSQFDMVAQDLGFGVTGSSEIKNMGRVAYSVRAPKGLTRESALRLLEDEFPGIVLDTSFQSAR